MLAVRPSHPLDDVRKADSSLPLPKLITRRRQPESGPRAHTRRTNQNPKSRLPSLMNILADSSGLASLSHQFLMLAQRERPLCATSMRMHTTGVSKIETVALLSPDTTTRRRCRGGRRRRNTCVARSSSSHSAISSKRRAVGIHGRGRSRRRTPAMNGCRHRF